MLKNYLITALRNMLRHKLYSFINIGGLSLGLAACLMIFLFVENELSYDKLWADYERIYRLEGTFHSPGKPDTKSALSPGPLSDVYQRRFSDSIENGTRLVGTDIIVKVGTTRFIEEAWYTDPSFFEIFNLPIVAGDANRLFEGYDKIVITQSMAEKYFGSESAVGRVLDIDTGEQRLEVVAVVADIPENSHLTANFLMHFEEARYTDIPWLSTWWVSSNVYTYFKFKQGASPAEVEEQIPEFMDANAVMSATFDPSIKASDILSLNFMPLTDIQLHSSGKFQIKETGDIIVVYSFTGIALMILVIAVINFTNLSTARASLRAQEIALRKVVGATRQDIMMQFIGEAVLTVSVAFLVALVIVELALPWFNNFVAKLLSFDLLSDPQVQLGLVGLIAVVSLGAAAHPALKMSSFRPAKVLHSKNAATAGSVKLRTILTMIQFTISIGLMVTTFVIYSQLDYTRNLNAGFDRDLKLEIHNFSYGPIRDLSNTMKQQIANLSGVRAVSYASRTIPLKGFWDSTSFVISDGRNDSIKVESVPASADFLQYLGAKLVAGRFFSEERQADFPQPIEGTDGDRTQSGIINVTTARQMGFSDPADAVGAVLKIPDPGDSFFITTVVGVVEDMHLRSLRDAMDNNVFVARDGPLSILNVSMAPGPVSDTLASIQAIWDNHAPQVPFDHSFIDETYDTFYAADARRGEVFAYFSAFAILVSCLGLYGLASFTAERRVKEIGVRKVMGASVADIVKLLTFQFSKPVLLANLIAWPVAWFVTSDWLQGFQYRIDLNPLYFLAAGGAALLIACLTVAGHAYKTAQANPVLALKHE